VLRRVRSAEISRLSDYEGPGYALATAIAERAGVRCRVHFFVPLPGAYTPTGKDWDFVAWRRRRAGG
jgi:hypothetical protein